jgi:hypothetical protein
MTRSQEEIRDHLLEAARDGEDPIDRVDTLSALKLNDVDFAVEVVSVDGCMLMFLNKALRANREVVQAAVSNNGLALEDADQMFRMDEAMVTEAVRQNGYALCIADSSFLGNKSVVIEAVRQNSAVLDRVHPGLQADVDVLRAAREESESCDPREGTYLPTRALFQ